MCSHGIGLVFCLAALPRLLALLKSKIYSKAGKQGHFCNASVNRAQQQHMRCASCREFLLQYSFGDILVPTDIFQEPPYTLRLLRNVQR